MNFQYASNKSYINALSIKKDSSGRGGRLKEHKNSEKKIFIDIKNKLELKGNDNLIDIGCGAGPVCDYIVKYAKKNKINLTLNDIPEVIKFLKKKYKKNKNIKYLPGEFQKQKIKKKFNKVLCYSVIQSTNNPKIFFNKILNIVNNQSLILIGDIPNTSKKKRFLTSKFGQKFEEKRIKKKINNINNYLKKNKQNNLINDELIKEFLIKSKKKGFNFFIFRQNNKLPFSYTREDILIEKF
ncbi:methyltransferase domain-containing protein [Pelagibacterales bacterium SAG-MED12]|nr:methyltransferase domain-containing protein [Pelagibacterales bacterium SAG-MED12]